MPVSPKSLGTSSHDLEKNLLMKLLYYGITLMILSIGFTSCFEDEDIFIHDGKSEFAGDISKLKKSLQSEAINHELNIQDLDTFLRLNEQYIITLTEENFLPVDSLSLPSQIEISFYTANKHTEWIGNGFSFIGEQGVIDVLSAAKLKICSVDGEKLNLNPDNLPEIIIEAPSQNGDLEFFIPEDNRKTNISNWKSVPGIEIERISWEEEDGNGMWVQKYGYQYPLQHTNWHLIGVESGLPNEVSLCANLPEGFTNNNTATFVLLKNFNSILSLDDWESYYNSCNFSEKLPLDQAVDIISISGVSGNRYFFDMKQTVLDTEDYTIHLDPKKHNLSFIKEQINNRN